MIGKVIRSNSLWKAVRVSVQQMKLNEIVNVYYNENRNYWAADPELKCSVGDLVLLQNLSQPQSDRIKHRVHEIVFPVGNIVDPVTGRRCRGPDYLDEVNRKFEKLSILS